jgi:hypothetical protein
MGASLQSRGHQPRDKSFVEYGRRLSYDFIGFGRRIDLLTNVACLVAVDSSTFAWRLACVCDSSCRITSVIAMQTNIQQPRVCSHAI